MTRPFSFLQPISPRLEISFYIPSIELDRPNLSVRQWLILLILDFCEFQYMLIIHFRITSATPLLRETSVIKSFLAISKKSIKNLLYYCLLLSSFWILLRTHIMLDRQTEKDKNSCRYDERTNYWSRRTHDDWLMSNLPLQTTLRQSRLDSRIGRSKTRIVRITV
jgi:hypothetical protein